MAANFYSLWLYFQSNFEASKTLFNFPTKISSGNSEKARTKTIKRWKQRLRKKNLLSVGIIEDVVDTFDVFGAPRLQWIGWRLNSAVCRHFVHYVPWNLGGCMWRWLSPSRLLCFIVSRLFGRYSGNESDQNDKHRILSKKPNRAMPSQVQAVMSSLEVYGEESLLKIKKAKISESLKKCSDF